MRVTSSDLSRNLARYCDMALTTPIVITRNGRDRLILLSIEQYEWMRDALEDRANPAEPDKDRETTRGDRKRTR